MNTENGNWASFIKADALSVTNCEISAGFGHMRSALFWIMLEKRILGLGDLPHIFTDVICICDRRMISHLQTESISDKVLQGISVSYSLLDQKVQFSKLHFLNFNGVFAPFRSLRANLALDTNSKP